MRRATRLARGVDVGRLAFLGRRPSREVREPAELALGIRDAEVWHPQAALLVGYADSLDGHLDAAALDELNRRFRGRSAEVPIGTSYMGLLLACASRRSGDLARARALVDELIAFARTTGEAIVEPELVRLRGELVEPTDPDGAAADYREAIALAAARQSRAFQLRAASSLARLWRTGDRRGEALALVADALAPLDEATLDVLDARALLA